jgi:SAM-dependent methyltransferase
MTTLRGEGNTTAPAAAAHDGLAAASQAQRDRFARSGDMWSGCAGSFKPELNVPLDGFLSKVAGYLNAGDTLLDVGGGAGRLSLPLGGRCREVICIDPSPAMAETFESTVRDAGIKNARFVHGGWLDVDGVEGDVSLVAHVTYFVPQIAPFIEKVDRATRRRVLVATHSVPPPNQVAPFFKLLRGEKLAPVPGHQELLAVLHEMDIPAELVDAGEARAPVTAPIGKTPAEAATIHVEGGVRLGWVQPDETERYRGLIDQHFDELFAKTDTGYRPRVAVGARELIITWETER